MPSPGVGQDIADICARCGDTWHVVMAKVGDRVVKVVCKLCGTQHNFRGEKNHPPPAAPGSWVTARRRRVAKRAQVAPHVTPPPLDPSRLPRAYSANDGYLPGERIIHVSFGVGVVSGSPGPGKVAVLFPSGSRTLACTKAVSTLARPVALENVPISDRPPGK